MDNMGMKGQTKEKFEFNVDFQELILRYTVLDKRGYKALQLYDDSYFTTIHHSVIAFALKRYYKKNKRVPELPLIRETLRSLYQRNNKLFSNLSKTDKQEINETIERVYQGPLIGGMEIYEGIKNFAKFVRFKQVLESVDVLDYDNYVSVIKDFKKATAIGEEQEEGHGTYLVEGMKDRAHKRDVDGSFFETPFWQFNRTLNAGGLAPGSVILIAGEAKRFKTGFLINIAKFYLRRRKKVIYFDFENSEKALTNRAEQSVIGADRMQIVSGELDEKLLKLMRKYKRIGAELVIMRFKAYTTSCIELQEFIDKKRIEEGLEFQECIIDNPDLMASVSGKDDEFGRISDVYVDVKNFSEYNKFESTWVPSHVKGDKTTQGRRSTRYTQNDLAKCIDKMRWVDCALGLQEAPEEIEAGIIRIEVMEQRDGTHGKMLFWVDWDKQQVREFTRKEVKEYERKFKVEYEENNKPKKQKRKPKNEDDL